MLARISEVQGTTFGVEDHWERSWIFISSLIINKKLLINKIL